LGTELRLADCYDRVGKTASAWALFKESQGLAHRQGEQDREELARERADELSHRLSYLVLLMDEPVPANVSLQRNGREVPAALLGSKVPVDPGPQTITASAPDRQARVQTVLVPTQPGETRLRISLEKAEPPQKIIRVKLRREAPPSDPKRTVGIVATLVGVAGVGTGLGLGWYAMHENDRSRADEYCPTADHNGCTHDGVALRQRARSFARASTITLAASGVVLATGIVLWSTAKGHSEANNAKLTELRVAAFPGLAQATLGASW
jgi:serine/threonine-protein kinase